MRLSSVQGEAISVQSLRFLSYLKSERFACKAGCAENHALDADSSCTGFATLFGVDLAFDDQVVFDVADQLLQCIDAARPDIGADEHVHKGITHVAYALI